MKAVVHRLLWIAPLTIALALVARAHAQPAAGSAGSADAGSGSAVAGSGSADAGSGSAVAAAGSGSSGSGSGSGSAAGSGSGSAAPAGSAKIAWYDVEANLPVDEYGTFWMPKSVNREADDSDMMFYAVLALSVFFFVAIAALVVYFTWKYRHRPGHKSEPSASHHDVLEITWTVIPTIIVVFLFYYGWRSYIRVVTPPTTAVEVNVTAKQWGWTFTHSNGVQDSDLHVPVKTPVRLVMTSQDVLHSFYIPVMRIKQDIIPRRYTYAWFYAETPGTYRLNCAEYCGTDHSMMGCTQKAPNGECTGRRAVVVVEPDYGNTYAKYLDDKLAETSNLPPAELGAKLYEKKGCNACHTTDGSDRVGPTWKAPGTWGKPFKLSDGSTVTMDENYIRESILSPNAKARDGFGGKLGQMPTFEGQLKDKELAGLIAYIKSLKQ